ncbi:MAG: polyphosphate polymerase domain-containing protein, partial [Candidatus Eisenbacteria bacterium]|nr:polyphosphate polymerase domain-containing protein [Candidatus Eisenbacteria bacterium]
YRYVVRSLYFDTPDLDYYWEKIDGIKIRKKVRIRSYDPRPKDNLVFVEIKRRENNRILKERCPLRFALLPQAMDGEQGGSVAAALPVANRLTLSRFRYLLSMYELKPTILITYDREAFVGQDNDRLRVTLDMDVRSRMCGELDDLFIDDGMKRMEDTRTILECKFDDRMPHWMVKMVRRLGVMAESVSKYCLSIEAWRGFPG